MTGSASDEDVRDGGSPAAATWIEPTRLLLDGVEFFTTEDSDAYMNTSSTPERFVLAKRPEMVEVLSGVIERLRPRHMVDLGIFKGGSTALQTLLARPDTLTAVELSPEPVDALHTFLDRSGLSQSVRCHYGVDQGDRDRLEAIITGDHGAADLDLVVDDASHLYRESRVSFETLFPRLRPGGIYMIEDWAWAHYPEPVWQRGGGFFHDRPALTNLIVEIAILLGSRSGLVADLKLTEDIALVTRGPVAVDAPMRLEEHLVNRGLPFRPVL